ncbi:class I adenylate-forming enzyme family protein [Acidithrix sp. C25]|uniref:class I adenylate-forming enzyme family protein n=1 Tax=Acidithrix sp. C25 TaxID=1671482 RepID=UPI00191B9BE8|nr:class I adenylate-forming enzyme family protein [Acidithrix sp. C25]CAG4927705.1 unnamed protein product [Acidithrix sp. C25]
MDYEEALLAITGAGQFFEIVDAKINGIEMKVFKNTPSCLGDLFANAAQHANEIAVVYEDERVSYETLMKRADAFADLLANHYGVQKGDRVAIAMRNLPEWIEAYIATLNIGAIATLINGWWQRDEIEYALGDATPKVLIADTERAKRSLAPASERGVPIVVVRSTPADDLGELRRFDPATWETKPYKKPVMDPDDDATILYTSGTTGFPKGALSTHRAIMNAVYANGARAQMSTLRYPPKQPSQWPTSFILAVPLFHVTGCVSVLLSSLITNSKLVLMHRWDPDVALAIIEEEHITHFIGVPTMSWDMLESPNFTKTDTSSLLSMGGGGSAVPPELIKRIANGIKNGRPGFGYGMTETNSYGPQIGDDEALQYPKSAGRSLPIVEIAILDPMGEKVPVGERGEICFKGATVIKEYWNKPEANAKTFVDGFLRSGDIGHLDENGLVYVDDRIKDMVIRGGENVYCAEVESAIYEYPAVYEAAVFGLPHPRLGEEVAASIYLKEGSKVSPQEISSFLSKKIASYKIPTKLYIESDPLPRGATGKIQKRELRDRHVD